MQLTRKPPVWQYLLKQNSTSFMMLHQAHTLQKDMHVFFGDFFFPIILMIVRTRNSLSVQYDELDK